MNNTRFNHLYQLAHGGDMVAKADLWLEFEFAYDHDPYPSLGRACPPSAPPPSALPVSPASCRSYRTAGVPPAPSNYQLPTPNFNAEGGTPCK